MASGERGREVADARTAARPLPVLDYLRRTWLNFLLVFMPISVALKVLGAHDVLVFVTSALAIVPLANLIGSATEELTKYLGPGIGGLLNATFGNATELIIVLLALRSGLTEVVKASISGSILGNILLVLGLAMAVGGWRREKQTFNRTSAGASATMLTLAVVALVMPAVFDLAVAGRLEPAAPQVFPLSLLVAAVLLGTYLASLVFSLVTHRELLSPVGHVEEPPPHLTRGAATGLLAVATALTAVEAEVLVGAIEVAAQAIGLSEFFVGIVVVAVVGNAAEHFAAVIMAHQNKMDLAVSIAINSATQIALLVAPVAVFASVLLGHPMALVFNAFEIAAVVLSVLIVSTVALDGESNWFEGLQLMAVYLIMVIVFLFVPS